CSGLALRAPYGWGILRLRSENPPTVTPEGPARPTSLLRLPSARIFRAALWSRGRLVPQSGHECWADRQPFPHELATNRSRTGLAGIGMRHGYGLLKSMWCLERKDAQEATPSRIGDAPGTMVVLEQVGRLHVLVRDRVVLAHSLKCRFVVEVLALALHLL